MIGSFKDRRLKRLYEAGDRSKLAPWCVAVKLTASIFRYEFGLAFDLELTDFH